MAAADWSEKTRMIVTIATGVVINLGLGYWLYTDHAEFKKQEGIKTTKLATQKQLHAYVYEEGPKIETQLRELQSESAAKESKLPEAEEVEKLIDSMAQIAQRTGCSRISATPVASTDSGDSSNYARSAWKTRWTADFFGWCKMLNEMEERFPRFISFENMTIQPRNSGMVPTGARHEISVDVVTYRFVKGP